MALRYGYFDSEITGQDAEGMPIFDRAETSDLFRLLFAKLVSNGVLASPADCFQVLADSGMNVRVSPGFGMIQGAFAYDEDPAVLTLNTAPTSYSRVDRIVLRANYAERLCEIIVKTGAPAATPTAPELEQPTSGDYFELGLANITVGQNVTEITQANITDTRADSSACGYITQLIDHLDTSVFFAQLNAFYDEYKKKTDASYADFTDLLTAYVTAYQTAITTYEQGAESDFNAWFAGIKEILNESAAGNLMDEINDLKDGVASRTQRKVTTRDADGSVTEVLADGRTKKTVKDASGSITETLSASDGTVIWANKTTKNPDGSITEEVITNG